MSLNSWADRTFFIIFVVILIVPMVMELWRDHAKRARMDRKDR